jgi:hypothetical protein
MITWFCAGLHTSQRQIFIHYGQESRRGEGQIKLYIVIRMQKYSSPESERNIDFHIRNLKHLGT